VLDRALTEPNRRKLSLAGWGLGAVVLIGALGWALPDDEPSGSQRPAAGATATTSAPAADGGSGGAPDLEEYFRQQDPDDKVAKHVEEIRDSGSFLRVYTDLDEGDANSKPALSLCEWTTDYLREHGDADEPIVFIHARENDNGNVVLANKRSAKDDCKVN
jgi:hypothetical protein